LIFDGGLHRLSSELHQARPSLFWLFLGGFCWVLGDLFQQYAAKYIGLGRGIPLSNTNQVWGLAWGAFVFGEMSGKSSAVQLLVLGGSLLTVLGATAIGLAEIPESEQTAWWRAVKRESDRYGLDEHRIRASLSGDDSFENTKAQRSWGDWLLALVALGIFVW